MLADKDKGVRTLLIPLLIAVAAVCGSCSSNNSGGGMMRVLCIDLAGTTAPAPGEVSMQSGANSNC